MQVYKLFLIVYLYDVLYICLLLFSCFLFRCFVIMCSPEEVPCDVGNETRWLMLEDVICSGPSNKSFLRIFLIHFVE